MTRDGLESIAQRKYSMLDKGKAERDKLRARIERDTAAWVAAGNTIEPAPVIHDQGSRRVGM
jgi:hypothetical protein